MVRVALLIALPALAALPGCTESTGRYPSLLPRNVEQADQSEPVRSVAVAIVDPALDAQVATLTATLAESAADFPAAVNRAESLTAAAGGAAVGSEAWLSAQSAISTLETLRAGTLLALADLDRLSIDRASAGLPSYPGIDTARDKAVSQVAAQQAKIDSLQARLATL